MQVLDQQIPPPRDVAKKREHIFARGRVDATAFGGRTGAFQRLFVSRHAFILCPSLMSRRDGRRVTLEGVMRVELLGLPRERAGVSEVHLEAGTLGQLLMALAVRFPAFSDLIAADRLQPSITANLNGDRFISDPRTQLGRDDSVLILSADAGG